MKWLDKLLGIERLDLGQPCNWEDIEVGEVFGQEGCFNIFLKTSENTKKLLTTTERYIDHLTGIDIQEVEFMWKYKLPKETQELFLVTED